MDYRGSFRKSPRISWSKYGGQVTGTSYRPETRKDSVSSYLPISPSYGGEVHGQRARNIDRNRPGGPGGSIDRRRGVRGTSDEEEPVPGGREEGGRRGGGRVPEE